MLYYTYKLIIMCRLGVLIYN